MRGSTSKQNCALCAAIQSIVRFVKMSVEVFELARHWAVRAPSLKTLRQFSSNAVLEQPLGDGDSENGMWYKVYRKNDYPDFFTKILKANYKLKKGNLMRYENYDVVACFSFERHRSSHSRSRSRSRS